MRSFACLAVVFVLSIGAPQARAEDAPVERHAQRIPFKESPTPVDEYGPRLGGSVLVLLAIAALAAYAGRRGIAARLASMRAADSRLKTVGRVSLGPRSALHLVELDGREILIGIHADRMVQIDPALSVAPQAQPGSGSPDGS